MAAWDEQFRQHDATVLIVRDDTATGDIYRWKDGVSFLVSDEDDALGKYKGIVARQSPACRCLGFAYIAKHLPDVEYIITLDDDVEPYGDTIGDHIAALDQRVPVSWMSSVIYGPHMRGFPYGVRQEAEALVSHGVWRNIPDLDAPTQLVLGDKPDVVFYAGVVPKGIYFPVCGMNLAFKRKALPMMLWCPAKWLPGAQRFDDIWMGIKLVDDLASSGGALVTGYAQCVHTRLSDTFKNLEQEATGIRINETLWRGDLSNIDVLSASFLAKWDACRRQWGEMLCAIS